MSAPPSSSPQGSPHLGPLSPPHSAELAAALAQNAQMQAAGNALQQKLAALEAEKNALQAAMQQQRASAASSAAGGSVASHGHPKGPTPPEFYGTKTGGYEIDAWVRDMRVQFSFYGARVFPDDAAKVRHAAMFLKGRAAEWWEAEDKSTGVESCWDKFVERLRERYRPMQAAVMARERLRRLKQTGSVSAYADVFQKELTPIKDMSPSDQIFNFVTGLSSVSVGNKVREKEPKTLHEAMDIAVRAEVFLAAGRGSGHAHGHGFGTRAGHTSSSSAASGASPMDLNAVGHEDADHSTREWEESGKLTSAPSAAGAGTDLSASLITKLETMMQHHIASMLQAKLGPGPFGGRSGGAASSDSRVPGLKASDIERCRAEGRCFRCKQKGHTKRECPQLQGKPSFQ